MCVCTQQWQQNNRLLSKVFHSDLRLLATSNRRIFKMHFFFCFKIKLSRIGFLATVRCGAVRCAVCGLKSIVFFGVRFNDLDDMSRGTKT